ncbi:MAG TPA: Ig-like domain-containing protein [Candidatus Limnocylindria bacterium]|nr:Ig-like domain-containing protein [Candidatus Limnocylindria bacterium]
MLLRTVAVFVVGAAILTGILYYASTVDSRPPTVSGITLTQHLSTDDSVALTTSSLDVNFSEPVDAGSAEAAFRVEPRVRGAFSWSGSTMIFTPSDPLPLSTQYRASVGPGVRDRAGNVMDAASQVFDFTTVGRPRVVASEPAADAADVPLDAPVVLTFSTLMDTASVTDHLSVTPRFDFRLRWSGEQLSIVPSRPLEGARGYVVRIDAAAEDVGGATLSSPYILRFVTVATGLEPGTLVPADGSQGIAVTSPIAVFFDRPLDPASVSNDLFTFTPALAGNVTAIAPPGAAGLDDDAARVLLFQPSGPMPPNTTFEVTLAGGLRAADGARLVEPLTWSFLTGAPTPVLGNQILFLSDRSGVTNLWAMNPEGTGQRQLSAELSDIVSYAVAPNGRSFVVGDGARLIEQHADGSARRVLTDETHLEFDPAYAPDGSQIAFGRADAATGAGQGLWLRAEGGGDERQLKLPDELTASPSPSPQASGEAPGPLLREPTFSPDGGALAFAIGTTRVGIVELPGERLTTAPFDATSPPVWLPDSSGLLLSGIPPDVQAAAPAGARLILPLSPSGRGLARADLGGLRIVRLDRGAAAVTDIGLPFGASAPAIDAADRIAYLMLGADPTADSGSIWVTRAGQGAGTRVTGDGVAVSAVSFAPDPARLVVGRADGGGIWVIGVRQGAGQQLSGDGSVPRWIP